MYQNSIKTIIDCFLSYLLKMTVTQQKKFDNDGFNVLRQVIGIPVIKLTSLLLY